MTQEVQIDLEYVRNTHIHFCMPCYGGQLTEACFMSFMKWANISRELGITWSVETVVSESLISRARNNLVAKFLSSSKSTHLMFVDADIAWEPWHILVLIDAKKPLIGGVYPIKKLPIEWCVNIDPEQLKDPTTNLVEVHKTGTGFLLISREVFTKLDQHPEVKHYTSDINFNPELDPYTKNYFDTAVKDNRYLSEDWNFCDLWRDLGEKVYVDKRVLLMHVGTFVYDIAHQDQVYQNLKKVYEQPSTTTYTSIRV